MADPTAASDPTPRGRAAGREPADGPEAGSQGAGSPATPVLAILLAACAGAADVLAFFGLGKAFAGIVTGNLVTAGYGIANGDTALIDPTFTAVAGFAAGAAAWARGLRRPGAALPLLITELALFLVLLAGWLAAGSRPSGGAALALLAVVSVALGGQSTWALRIHQTTTYFTGMVTESVGAAAAGSPASVATSIRQVAALLAGAILGGVALHWARPATPVVPLALLASAAVVHFRQGRRPRLPAPRGRTSEPPPVAVITTIAVSRLTAARRSAGPTPGPSRRSSASPTGWRT